jgi:ribonuclease P protein component
MADARLRRRERIHGDVRFRNIRGSGAAAGDEVLFVRALGNGLGLTRLGLAVGRSAGGAVARARLRRRLREAFRHHKAALPPGLDLLVAPRRRAAGAAPEALARSLVALAAQVARELKLGGEGTS